MIRIIILLALIMVVAEGAAATDKRTPYQRDRSSPRIIRPGRSRTPVSAPLSTVPGATAPATGGGGWLPPSGQFYAPQSGWRPIYRRAVTNVTVFNASDRDLTFELRPAYGQWHSFTLGPGYENYFSNADEIRIWTTTETGQNYYCQYRLFSEGYFELGMNDRGLWDVFVGWQPY